MSTSLQPGWEKRMSKSRGIPYYYHTSTGTTQWEPPLVAAQVPNEPELVERVRCFHILAKHTESRRPLSRKKEPITRTKAEAYDLINFWRTEIVNGKSTFEDIAKQFSDCSSGDAGGDLGYFTRGKMQPSFEKASFALQPDEMSQAVETDSGIHLIWRRTDEVEKKEETKPAPMKFGFKLSNKPADTRITPSTVASTIHQQLKEDDHGKHDDDENHRIEKITSIHDGQVQSVKGENPAAAPLIIPLIGALSGQQDTNIMSSLLSRHQKIEGSTENERFQSDFSQRPEIPSLQAYEEIPVDSYGAAMLRGMGLQEGERLGRTSTMKRMATTGNHHALPAEPVVPQHRHHRLGLGATPRENGEPALKKKP